jgi:ribose 1,5-bisphosphokinase PhnN
MDIKFTKEQTQTLSLGPNYAIEKEPKMYINESIVDMENATRQLEPKIQNIYRHLAAKQIKYIITNRHNVLHKRYQHNVNQLKKTLKNNNLTIVKADKNKL